MMSSTGCVGSSASADGWRAEADARIERIRKGDFVVTVADANGRAIPGAAVEVRQVDSTFHFGTCITGNPLKETPVERSYFGYVDRMFNTVVDENSMKWYATEKTPGQITYDMADLKLQWAEANGLAMRGHCLFWCRRKFVQDWVEQLPADQLKRKMAERLERIVPRYRGRLIAWDVNNEMLDGSFFVDQLGPDIRAWMFRRTAELDPCTPLFTNEFGILGSVDKRDRYIELIKDLVARGAAVGGIGIQEHACERFVLTGESEDDGRPERKNRHSLTPEECWRDLDALGELGLPIHLTEISSKTADPHRRADTLETLLRVGFAHESVEAILLWGFWAHRHWLGADAALLDKDFSELPASERIARLIHEEWRTDTRGRTDEAGRLAFRGFYGTYRIVVTRPDGTSFRRKVKLDEDGASAEVRPK